MAKWGCFTYKVNCKLFVLENAEKKCKMIMSYYVLERDSNIVCVATY
jgi:hypothetical protein